MVSPAPTVKPKVTNWLPASPPAEVAFQPVPPQELLLAVSGFSSVTPLPRVRPSESDAPETIDVDVSPCVPY